MKKPKHKAKPAPDVTPSVPLAHAPLGAYIDLPKLVDTCSSMARSSYDGGESIYRKLARTPQETILATILWRIAIDCDHAARLARDLAPKPEIRLAM